MAERLLELLTLLSRFWFLFLIILLAWGAFKATRRDLRDQRKLKNELAGGKRLGHLKYIGRSTETLERGREWIFYRESTVGSAKNCDVILDHPSIQRYHARLFAVEGYLACEPSPEGDCYAAGEQFFERTTFLEGEKIVFGELPFRVVLYDQPLDQPPSARKRRLAAKKRAVYDVTEEEDDG